MVICPGRGADLHMAQLMLASLIVSCFSKIQIGHASTSFKASGLADKALWSWRIFFKQMQNSSISKNKCNSPWSFSPTSELRIISQQHVNCCQLLSTVNWWPSPVIRIHCPALCTAWWQLGVMQCIAQFVGVSQNLYSYYCCCYV